MIGWIAAQAMTVAFAASSTPAGTSDCAQNSTVAIEDCQQRQLKAANDRLNAAYRARMGRLAPAQQVSLRKEERQWIAARDARCMVGSDQGSAGPLAAATCLLAETDARTKILVAGR